MKLSRIVLSELFDKMDFDGISVDGDPEVFQSSGVIRFYFVSDGTRYTVSSHIHYPRFSQSLSELIENQKAASISLTVDGEYTPTNKGNFGDVYSKLLAIVDYVLKQGVTILLFSGHSSSMDLVYRKMVNRFAKMGDPVKKMHHIGGSYWISEAGILKIDDLAKRQRLIEMIKEKEDVLKANTELKRRMLSRARKQKIISGSNLKIGDLIRYHQDIGVIASGSDNNMNIAVIHNDNDPGYVKHHFSTKAPRMDALEHDTIDRSNFDDVEKINADSLRFEPHIKRNIKKYLNRVLGEFEL